VDSLNFSQDQFSFAGSDSNDALAAKAGGAAHTAPTPSFLRPMTAYGDTYTPSYTRYQNSPAQSYTHPLYNLFNDRRQGPASQAPSALTPTKGAM
jgi:hypothetical protein